MIGYQKELLNLARTSIKQKFEGKEISEEEKYPDKKGVFVSLYKENEYRNSMGIFETTIPLGIAIPHLARSAAFEDKKQSKLGEKELEKIKIEIAILTEPELVKKEEIMKIKLGENGLIAKSNDFKGAILPEHFPRGISISDMLDTVCRKAGLLDGAWKDENIKVYKFKTERFRE